MLHNEALPYPSLRLSIPWHLYAVDIVLRSWQYDLHLLRPFWLAIHLHITHLPTYPFMYHHSKSTQASRNLTIHSHTTHLIIHSGSHSSAKSTEAPLIHPFMHRLPTHPLLHSCPLAHLSSQSPSCLLRMLWSLKMIPVDLGTRSFSVKSSPFNKVSGLAHRLSKLSLKSIVLGLRICSLRTWCHFQLSGVLGASVPVSRCYSCYEIQWCIWKTERGPGPGGFWGDGNDDIVAR